MWNFFMWIKKTDQTELRFPWVHMSEGTASLWSIIYIRNITDNLKIRSFKLFVLKATF